MSHSVNPVQFISPALRQESNPKGSKAGIYEVGFGEPCRNPAHSHRRYETEAGAIWHAGSNMMISPAVYAEQGFITGQLVEEKVTY